MPPKAKPHALNVLGPFYVEDGCCTMCGVPEHLAPTLFGEDDSHCFVKQQPRSASELDAMLRVVASQELGCVRYRGTDEPIIRRLVEAGEADQCDAPAPPHLQALQRDHVSFLAVDSSIPWNAEAIAVRLVNHLATLKRFTLRRAPSKAETAVVNVAWFEDRFHRIEIRNDRRTERWIVRHHGPRGLSDTLHDWIMVDDAFVDVRWQTEEQFLANGAWLPTPW